MTDFKPNVTKSIDNLNQADIDVEKLNVDFSKVFSDETKDKIDDIYENNIVSEVGTNITLQDTVENGKIDYSLLGDCEQNTIAYIDVGTIEQGSISGINGLNEPSNSYVRCSGYISVKPNIEYTITRNVSTARMRFRFYDSSKNFIGTGETTNLLVSGSNTSLGEGVTTGNITIANTSVVYFRFDDNSNNLTANYTLSTQAPTPVYPQDIEVVTGEQTVTISDGTNSQEYTIDLGSQELCKIGDYQDYITGSKNNWKVVNNIGKVDLNDLEYYKYLNLFSINTIPNIKYVPNNQTLGVGLAEKYKLHIGSGMSSSDALNCIAIDVNQVGINTLENKPSGLFYYALAEQTETPVTDTDLINDLNDLYDASLYEDVTNITNSGNLPAILDITYFKKGGE